jgi:hypothetical protein
MVFSFQTFMELPTIMVPDGVGPIMNVFIKGRLGWSAYLFTYFAHYCSVQTLGERELLHTSALLIHP